MNRKTTEQFKEEVYNLVGNEYTVLGEYINNYTKILIKHNICNLEYEIIPSDFINKNANRCPICYSRKKNTKKFEEEVYDLIGTEYTVFGTYVNNRTKIEMKHNKCGHEYMVTPSDFLSGSRCPICFGTPKKTTEQFKQEVYNLVGKEYTVLGEYINNHTKIKVKHNKCDYEYEIIPSNFLKGNRCPICYGNKKNTKKFKEEVYNLVGNEYTVLGEYVDSKTKIKMKHNKCCHEYMVTPSNFLKGNRCPICFGKKKNTKRFKEDVYELVGDEYTVLGKYVDSKTKIKMKHKKCGHEYMVTPRDFKDNSRCPKCYGNEKKTTEQFKEEVYNLVGNEYTVLGEYVNNKTKIKMKHKKCGHKYNVKPSNFLTGNRCPKCFGAIKKTTEQFKEEVYELVGNEYTVLGEYINNINKVKMKHNKCNYEYEVAPCKFLGSNRRCPKCKESKGEAKIDSILEKYNIEYVLQYKIDKCRYKNTLPFDFALFKEDELILLIEYDGELHYKAVDYFGGKETLTNTKLRDNIKTQYCRENNIPLLRIPYWEFDNINKIILKKLFRLGLI